MTTIERMLLKSVHTKNVHRVMKILFCDTCERVAIQEKT